MSLKCALFPLTIAALASALVGFATKGEAADSFYEGKILRIVVGAPAGSGYDLYARILAQFLPDFIPGHPTIAVEDMPGANSVLAAQYMFNIAPRDGTMIASAADSLAGRALLHPDIATFDITKLSWIGSITSDIHVAYVWHAAPIQSYEDAKQTPAVMGGVAIGAPSIDFAVISNALFGTKFRIVPGYAGDPAVALGMARGEVDGSFGAVYSTVKVGQNDWLRDHLVKIILQDGPEPLPELADVPLFIDQAKTPDEREILQFLLTPQQFAKPYYAPPGVPAERLEVLRNAFLRTIANPGFLAAAAKANVPVTGPLNGEKLAAAIAQVSSAPPALVERVRSILASFTQQ